MGFTASDNKKHAEVCHRGLSCGCGLPRLPHLRLRPEPLRLCWTPLRRLCWLRCLSLLRLVSGGYSLYCSISRHPPPCSPSNLPSVIYAKQKLYGLTLLTGRVSSVLT